METTDTQKFKTVAKFSEPVPAEILADVLLHLDNKLVAIGSLDRQCFMNFRQHLFRIQSLGIEIDVDYRTDNLGNVSINL